MSVDAMKQALEALDSDNPDIQLRAAAALRLAIEQAEFDAAHETLEREAGIHISQQQAERQEPVALERMQRGMAILDWNRAQEEPPIAVTKELWVAEQLERFYAAPPQRQPLTAREVELIDGMIEVQLHHAEQCDRIANRVMAEKQKGWDMERVELLRKLKAAHGIGGGE
jgi:hypothetical protein